MFTGTSALAVVLFAAALMSGCASDGGTRSRDASLNYDGAGSGTHQRNADCAADAQVTIASTMSAGQITVSVRDGDNKEVHHDTYEGRLDGESESLDGAAGRWTLQVDRSDDFAGSYTVTLGC